MFTYKLNKVSQLGERDDKYGTRFWCQALDSDKDISFNIMEGTVSVGDTIDADEKLVKITKKGQEYYQLKKVKVLARAEALPEAPTPRQTASVTTDFAAVIKALKEVNSKLDKLLGNDAEMDNAQAQAKRDQQAINNTFSNGEPLPEDGGFWEN